MNKLWILVLVTLVSSKGTQAFVRNDLIPSPTPRQGCVWSTINNNTSTSISRNLDFSLDCNLRTLNIEFWNYTFNRDQIDKAVQLRIGCNDKLYFESFLNPSQSLFRLVNLKQVEIGNCKIRKIPTRIFSSLGFLQKLQIQSYNGDWSSSTSLEIEAGSFEGLGRIVDLDLSYNNIWSLPKNLFCPVKGTLLKLNMSHNRMSEVEELSGGDCDLSIQLLDLSYNVMRKVTNNAFSGMKKVQILSLQNNFLEEIEDSGFEGLNQLQRLNMSSNRLVALPPSIFRDNTNLREIILSNNSISALSPQVFRGLDNLISLDLSKNTLTSQWIKGNMFSGLVKLKMMKLNENQLSYVDALLFRDLVSLQAIYLNENRLETMNPEAFIFLKNLQTLDISRNRLSYVDGKTVANLPLRQLYLDHNKIQKIDDNAFKNLTLLQDLGLADNLLLEVPVAVQNLRNLFTLDIGENKIITVSNSSFSGLLSLIGLRIVDNKIESIPTGFCSVTPKLRVLNAAQNKISSISSSAFTSCPDLRALRLDTNSLRELPVSLGSQLPSLLWLNVSENQLTWVDYQILPPTLEWLDLSYNRLQSLGGPSGVNSATTYSLRVIDASFNEITSLDYTAILPTLETLRVNYNKLKSVAPDTFLRAGRVRRVELMGNQLQSLPLSAIRIPPVPQDKPVPEFYLGQNNFTCSCEMEWLSRVNQLSLLKTHPKILDLDTISCRPTFSRPNHLIPLAEMRPQDFLCPYESHCFTLCHCCDFEFCDCEMTCPEGCECYHDNSWSMNIVDCSNSNFTQLPSRLPMDSTEIYLDGSNLKELGSHIFIGKKSLKVLFLNGSNIEVIRNKTFNGLGNLQVLRLEDNNLSGLYGFEFADLVNLQELYLQNNVISYIAPETFAHLQFLQVLRLDGNLLIDFNVWELGKNGYLNSLTLAGNQWTCECEFLIPFRTWVASKPSIVVDFNIANCHNVTTTQIIPGHEPDKVYPFQHPISEMCDHNPELKFNFNPIHQIESEILSNHISAMAGGAEKVHSSSSDITRQFTSVDESYSSSESTFWSLVLTLTALMLLVVVIVAIFRKEIYYWIYSRMCSNKRNRTYSSPFLLCCGEKGGKANGMYEVDDSDKLFDAYFIYGKKDEDILVQKIAPELESQNQNPIQSSPNLRLCLHYRDLCLSSEAWSNTDMILTATEASKRVVIVLSRSFLQSELSHPHFRQVIQSVINRHQKKLILVLLPPLSEQNLSTVYPEFKGGKSNSTLEWSDKNFWSKFKLVLPSNTNMSTSSTLGRNTGRRRGSSLLISSSGSPGPLIDLQTGIGSSNNSNASGTMSSYTINRLDFPYSSQHRYQTNAILPYQIPVSSATLGHKHHIATLSSPPPFFQTQGHHLLYHPQSLSLYNASQYSSVSQQPPPPPHYFIGNNNNELPRQIGTNVVYPAATLPNPHHFPFNESFRRHLLQQQQQQQNATPILQQFAKQGNRPGGGNGSTVTSSSNNRGLGLGYQPLEPNYSSSAISSSAEELEHVYSTLDSPQQSPRNPNSSSNPTGESANNHNGENVEFSHHQVQAPRPHQPGSNGQMYFV